jgi:hypothetical protein
MWFLLTSLLFFVGMVILLAFWKRKGILTDKRFAFAMAVFFSLTMILVILVFAKPTWQNVALAGGIGLFQFLVSYFSCLWLYRFMPF